MYLRNCNVVGMASTLAGSGSYAFGDGVGSAASFKSPRGITVSSNGDVFVADTESHRIRMITSAGLRALCCILLNLWSLISFSLEFIWLCVIFWL